MFKNSFVAMVACCVLLAVQFASAQGKTADELKAEREVLKSEMKSKKALERKERFEKLEVPEVCSVASIDALSADCGKLLISTKEINTLLPEMYKRTIGETVDGVTDVTVKKPTLDEVVQLSMMVTNQVQAVADAAKTVSSASADLKSISPLNAGPAKRSLNFSKEVISLTGPELELNLKMIQNLIETVKTSKNL